MNTLRRNMLRILAAGVLGAATVSATLTTAAGLTLPAKPESGTLKMGIEPWLGYGPWQIAKEKGFFKKNGLDGVDIVNFTEDKDLNAALASGNIDAANVAAHTAMIMVAAGLPVKVVQMLDVSMTADAIIAGKGITSIKDLKGKQVAYEQGTTSDLLLNYALAANGMTIKDIQPVPMPAANAGSALIAGRVPVAVTYEPYLTTAMKQNKDVKELFPASKDPGLISDVLVVRTDYIKSHPGQIAAMLKSWDDAVKAYRADPKEGRAIISKSVGATPEELGTAFDGVKFYDLAQNKKALGGDFVSKTYKDIEAAAIKAGLLQEKVPASKVIDTDFVKAVK